MIKKYKDKEWLENKYWEEELSKTEIAKLCNTGYSTIHYWMIKLNIPRRSQSEALKGRIFSEEHINNLSESHKGHMPWNKGRKDCYSEEIIERMVKSHMGQIAWNKGIPHSQMTKDKISEVAKKRIGINSPMWGKHHSEETKEKMRGKNSWNWKGGITSLRHSIRTSFKYRQWRDDIFTRDNFTCQYCGQVGGNLEAHHIKSFDSILQKYEITTLEEALDCEELWNINNGITLCKKCHKKLHKRMIRTKCQSKL